jgi:membrane associated rhomboid family serine protease
MRPASVGFHCPDDVNLARKTVRAPRTSVGASVLHTVPYVTTMLIVANVIVYFIVGSQSVHGLAQAGDGSSKLFQAWQLFTPRVHADHQYYRLLTATFLHVSVLHIGSNMLALAFIGPPLERLLGPWRFLTVYVLAGLGGSAAVYAFGQVNTPEVGASGAIFGLFAACLVLHRRLGLDLQWLVGIVVINFVLTFSIHNISKLGHVGGFIVGGLAAIAIGGLPQMRERFSVRTQVVGLGAVAAAVAVTIVARTATF